MYQFKLNILIDVLKIAFIYIYKPNHTYVTSQCIFWHIKVCSLLHQSNNQTNKLPIVELFNQRRLFSYPLQMVAGSFLRWKIFVSCRSKEPWHICLEYILFWESWKIKWPSENKSRLFNSNDQRLKQHINHKHSIMNKKYRPINY